MTVSLKLSDAISRPKAVELLKWVREFVCYAVISLPFFQRCAVKSERLCVLRGRPHQNYFLQLEFALVGETAWARATNDKKKKSALFLQEMHYVQEVHELEKKMRQLYSLGIEEAVKRADKKLSSYWDHFFQSSGQKLTKTKIELQIPIPRKYGFLIYAF